jgi:hypothetical protein
MPGTPTKDLIKTNEEDNDASMDNTLDAPGTPTKAAEPNKQGKEETYIAGDMLAPRNAQVVRALEEVALKFAVGERG